VADNFDLFGDPVPTNRGKRGRPEHVPTQENRNRVNTMLSAGWSGDRIAGVLRITMPTLRKHYFSELKAREVARDRLNAMLLTKAVEQATDGKVTAIKLVVHLLERNDLMLYGQTLPQRADKSIEKPAKAAKLGKKEEALLAAHQPDAGTPLGELMARRQQSMN
jgi:hypothetical protein